MPGEVNLAGGVVGGLLEVDHLQAAGRQVEEGDRTSTLVSTLLLLLGRWVSVVRRCAGCSQ